MNDEISRFPRLSGTLSMMISEMLYRAVVGVAQAARLFDRTAS